MRKFIHIDMDCFFAAIEMRDNPQYQQIPIAIGGRTNRGVVATCNYLARQFGVRSAMPVAQALKLCPELTLVPANMQKYRLSSKKIMQILSLYSPLIEIVSVDEAYLDVSDSKLFHGSASLLANHIRQHIFEATGLTASAGIAPLKYLAKIASDINKPNGQFLITPNNIAHFLHPLPVNKIPGIGPKSAQKLANIGIEICSDLTHSKIKHVEALFGQHAQKFIARIEGREVGEITLNRTAKSKSVEKTFSQNIRDIEQLKQQLSQLLTQLTLQLQRKYEDRFINKLSVKIKFSDFRQTTIEQTCHHLDAELCMALLQLGLTRSNQAVRLLGIGVSFQDKASFAQQLSLPIPPS